jgi:AcrR family transcriptional regulator
MRKVGGGSQVSVAATRVDDTSSTGSTPFRRRLLDGLAESIAERGYRATTVADVVRGAKTSKRTFYDEFASKEECFVELLAANNDDLIAGITAAVDGEATPEVQIAAAVAAYVGHIESRPAITLSWIREAPALGDLARPLNRVAMQHLTDMLVAISHSPGFARAGLAPISRPLALILLGGLRELTALLVEDGQDVQGIVEPAVTAARAILGLPVSRG